MFRVRRKINGIMDSIRCDEKNFLVWKWRPTGCELGESGHENAIRWGSSLRVREGQVAIFMCNYEEAAYYDSLEGPCDLIIETENIPVIANLVERIYGGGVPFPAEVYFINVAELIQIKFGVPFFDVFDPFHLDFSVPVAVRGTISFRIADYWEFVRLNGLRNLTPEEFQMQIRDAICRYVKDIIANAPAEYGIPVAQIESKLSQINDVIEYDIGARLRENFGVDVSAVDVAAIEVDKSSSNYRQLMSITRDATGAVARAELDARLKDIAARQRIEEENYAEELRIQREESQYAQRMHTRTANLSAYQVEAQTEVGVTGAEALGKMAGDCSAGGSVFNPAAVMMGMTVGGAVGQNVAGVINNMTDAHDQQHLLGVVPPPIPTVAYYVAVNGQPAGPFNLTVAQQMIATGQITSDSLVWKAGMASWSCAGAVDDLKHFFGNFMPPIPSVE